MSSISCFTPIVNAVSEGINYFKQHSPFSQPNTNDAEPLIAHRGHPAEEQNAGCFSQRGWHQFLQFFRISRDASPERNGTHRFSYDILSYQPNSGNSLNSNMRKLADNMLVPPVVGEIPGLDETAWSAISEFDAQRRAGKNCADLLDGETSQLIRSIAEDANHPFHADARLLRGIMDRPIDESAPSLENYLAAIVSEQLKETVSGNFDTTLVPDLGTPESVFAFVRTFNNIMFGLSLNSQDYMSCGRTLLFNGAKCLTDLTGKPGATGILENGPFIERLQKVTFCFPTVPGNGQHKLNLNDFNEDPDPLEIKFGKDIYLSANSYLRGA